MTTSLAITTDTLRAKLGSSPEMIATARRAVWFQPPEATLDDPVLFLSHLMTYTGLEDEILLDKKLSKADIAWVLEHAPAGVFDEPSWHYWHVRIGHYDIPPMPRRVIPGVIGEAAE